MKKIIQLLIVQSIISFCTAGQSTIRQYLSGTDKDHTVQWDFFCTKGMNSGKWSRIAVPSNWEQQSFGGYSYGHDKVKTDEQGLYKYRFTIAKASIGKKVFIVFEGSMTDTEVKINGKLAGPVHQGGFYRFKYDITGLVKFGQGNLLEITVSKMSAQSSVNRAERNGDFWTLGGIYRPVYLEIVPGTFIDRVAIDAKADGSFNAEVYALNTAANNNIEAQVQTLQGENVGEPFTVNCSSQQQKYILAQHFTNPQLWNPEFPHLYQVVFSVKNATGIVHTIIQKFGFRTAELRRQDGFYVNGIKIIFKGVCRHSEWPETGRALSKDISLLDIGLMKEMNMNAVRMSHYPPDQHFLDVCDSLGMFVLDELTGWQASYDTIAGRPLVKELVERDVNHPSVVIWDNGNEGGWNRALDNDYALYDPQKRLVIHPWEKFNGTDTKHYPDYNYVINSSLYGKDVFFPTEFMHGLYDGGHGAGLEDFWNAILQHPYGAGGFLWCFHDEGIVRRDKKDSIDTDGNHAPDGIVGPHREKEASFYTIKELWSPVYIKQAAIPPTFNGQLSIENRFLYTNLNQCTFQWKLGKLPAAGDTALSPMITASGDCTIKSLVPGEKGFLSLNLPGTWNANDILYLTAFDPYKKEIFTWTWPLKTAGSIAQSYTSAITGAQQHITVSEEDSNLVVHDNDISYYFNKKTGQLSKVKKSPSIISLSGAMPVSGVKYNLKELKHYSAGLQYIVEPVYEGESFFAIKWIFTPGAPVQLTYSYAQKGPADMIGLSFDYPEEKITGIKWMGRGPYRAWKNRLKGQQFGVWHKQYNSTVTGEDWIYPEFKGYHAECYWATIETKESSFTIINGTDGIFLQLLRPSKPLHASNNNTSPAFPEGNIGLMSAIPPIGTKFQSADKLGPQSQQNMQLNYAPFSGTVWFDFR